MAMGKEGLFIHDAASLYVLAAAVSEATDFAYALARGERGIIVRFLRGRKMKKLQPLYDECAAALQFPYYFGENWNAFFDCITDLSWMPGEGYILMITDSAALLSEENGEQLDALINVFQEAGELWSQPVETTEAWARPAVAFHVIFQCDEADKTDLVSRLEAVKAPLKELRLQSA
jgi:RNAse (barnase) inhibitor barstar